MLAIFRKELSKNIDTRARVARFAHLHCSAGLSLTQFLMMEIVEMSRRRPEDDDQYEPPTVAYVLPDDDAVDMIRHAGAVDGLWIFTPASLMAAISSGTDLHRFIIVFDSDRGRYPTGIVIAAETVAQHWAQMAAQKESYSGTLIVVSPDKGCPLWCQDGLRTAFIGQGCWKEFSFPASFPRTAVREGKLGEEDSNLTQFIANKIFKTAYLGGDPKKKDVLKKHTVIIAVLPEDIIDGVLDEFELHRDQVPLPRSEIQDLWEEAHPEGDETVITDNDCFVFETRILAARIGFFAFCPGAAKGNGRRRIPQVRLVGQPSHPFRTGPQRLHDTVRHDEITSRRRVFSRRRHIAAYPEVWTSGEGRGICGLGQLLGGQAVLVVLDDDETASNRITSSVTHQGIQEFPHETLLCHMSQREAVKYNYRPLPAWPPGIINMTGLHQLEQLGFVKLNARSTNPLRDADYNIEDLYKFPPHTT